MVATNLPALFILAILIWRCEASLRPGNQDSSLSDRRAQEFQKGSRFSVSSAYNERMPLEQDEPGVPSLQAPLSFTPQKPAAPIGVYYYSSDAGVDVLESISGTGSPPLQEPSQQVEKRPNVVLFLTDDMGWADVSFTEGLFHTPTPNIDKFAWDGVILGRHYVSPSCTPTRAALMTGKYPMHIGVQGPSITTGEPWGVPLEFKFLPQYLKDLGYYTYITGKWHLGEYTRRFYPENRGFDRAYYYTNGESNWFNYTVGWLKPFMHGRQLRDQGKAVWENVTQNVYLPHLVHDKAIQFIRHHDPDQPFFLFVSTPLIHTAIDKHTSAMHTMPQYQLRPSVFTFTEQFPTRRQALALIQAMDESFRLVTDALINKGVINDTILIFFSDNGAPLMIDPELVHGFNGGSNWPLRHGKGGLFEGGVRSPGFVWSNNLRTRSRIYKNLFHAADWLPTIYEAAGGNVADLRSRNLDGVSHWKQFTGQSNQHARRELVLNINHVNNQFGMIWQEADGKLYKVLGGPVLNNNFTGWLTPQGTTEGDIATWREATPLSVNCNGPFGFETNRCAPWEAPCLFALHSDPCEQRNLVGALGNQQLLGRMLERIRALNATFYPLQAKPFDEASDPVHWQGWVVPWRDPQPWDPEPLTFEPFEPSTAF